MATPGHRFVREHSNSTTYYANLRLTKLDSGLKLCDHEVVELGNYKLI